MKKNILLLIVFGAFIITSCKNDDDGDSVDCSAVEETYFDAQAAYNLNSSSGNCNAYKAAIEAYKSGNCVKDADKDFVNNQLASLNCSS